MRQFQVPQFITVEDKVIGPFTVKQFLYVGTGALLILAARFYLAPFLFWPVAVLAGGLAAALAFLKINERPFPVLLKNAVFYLLRPRLFIWKQSGPEKPGRVSEKEKKPETVVQKIPKLSESRLSDLAWSLDIKEKTRE